MKINLNKLPVELSVTRHVARLYVMVVSGKGMEKKLTISEATVEVVWRTGQLALLVGQKTGVVSLNVLNRLF